MSMGHETNQIGSMTEEGQLGKEQLRNYNTLEFLRNVDVGDCGEQKGSLPYHGNSTGVSSSFLETEYNEMDEMDEMNEEVRALKDDISNARISFYSSENPFLQQNGDINKAVLNEKLLCFASDLVDHYYLHDYDADADDPVSLREFVCVQLEDFLNKRIESLSSEKLCRQNPPSSAQAQLFLNNDDALKNVLTNLQNNVIEIDHGNIPEGEFAAKLIEETNVTRDAWLEERSVSSVASDGEEKADVVMGDNEHKSAEGPISQMPAPPHVMFSECLNSVPTLASSSSLIERTSPSVTGRKRTTSLELLPPSSSSSHSQREVAKRMHASPVQTAM